MASLSARTTLVLLAGMLVSNMIGLLIFAGERTSALSDIAGVTNAVRIAGVIRTIGALPARERDAALCSESGLGLTLAFSDTAIARANATSGRARALDSALRTIAGFDSTRPTLIDEFDARRDDFSATLARCETGPQQPMFQMMGRDDMMNPAMRRNMQKWRSRDSLVLSHQLKDGVWLNILTPAPEFAPLWKSRFLLAFVVTMLLLAALSVWASRRTTQPLALFAWAAARLGRDVNAPDLPEKGPREVVRAARAFNEMQRRLRHLIRSRTQMLAAISHDLRTPITRLRLRAEFIEDTEQRDKMLGDLAQMEAMITATLAFARLDNSDEKPRPLDLAGLIEVACDDAAELGQDVTLKSAGNAEVDGRPVALRRVLDNLIDNAVKYGQRARVCLETTPTSHIITIDDDGPGIPADELDRVFDPFHRVDPSRNPMTGGVGLGLAVVRSIIEGHGGTVRLENRPDGGLRASVTLPVRAMGAN